MAGRFSVETIFKAVDKLTAPVSRMQNSIGKFTRSASDGLGRLNRRFSKVSDGIKKVGRNMLIGAAVIGGAMTSVVATGAQFEQSIVNASAKFPEGIKRGTDAFKALEDAARKTGSTTEFTASQSAEALNFLAMAGFNAENAIAALPGVVDLATASSLDLGTATDIASDSLGAFNLMTKDSQQLGRNLQRVNDVIAKTATSANTSVTDLFEAIKDGGPVATTAGASLETFASLAGTLANAGIKGSRAGTTLKNTFLSIAAPSTSAAKILKRLSVSTQDADGNMLDIVETLDSLNKALDGLGTAERSAILEGIFGKIPIAGVNVLLAAGTDQLKDYRRALEGAGGASAAMAQVMRDTLQGRLNSLKSAVEGVSISLFSMTNGPLVDAIEKTTEFVRANEQLIATNLGGFLADVINNFELIVTRIKQIAIGLAVFYALNVVLQTFIGIMTAVNLVMAMNPIGLIVLGVAALIAAFVSLVVYIDEISEGFENLHPIIEFVLTPLHMMIKAIKFIKDNIGVLSVAYDKVSGIFGSDDEADQVDGRTGATMITPQERIARSIEESRTTSTAEVTIKDESGRAAVTGGRLGDGINMVQSGGF
jgi:TP901 family phage tail tape measure protein